MNVTPDQQVGVKAEPWQPQAPEGQTPEDLSLAEWIGQAIGRASTCWVGGTGALEFDGSSARAVAFGLVEHIEGLMTDVARDTVNMLDDKSGEVLARFKADNPDIPWGANLGMASTRQMLAELEARFRDLPNAKDAIEYLLFPGNALNEENLNYRPVDS